MWFMGVVSATLWVGVAPSTRARWVCCSDETTRLSTVWVTLGASAVLRSAVAALLCAAAMAGDPARANDMAAHRYRCSIFMKRLLERSDENKQSPWMDS